MNNSHIQTFKQDLWKLVYAVRIVLLIRLSRRHLIFLPAVWFDTINQTVGRHIRCRPLRRWKPACKKNVQIMIMKVMDLSSGLVVQSTI